MQKTCAFRPFRWAKRQSLKWRSQKFAQIEAELKKRDAVLVTIATLKYKSLLKKQVDVFFRNGPFWTRSCCLNLSRVKFMGETAKILSPEKTILHLKQLVHSTWAVQSMSSLWSTPWPYCSCLCKHICCARADWVVTSSCAVEIVEQAWAKKLFGHQIST